MLSRSLKSSTARQHTTQGFMRRSTPRCRNNEESTVSIESESLREQLLEIVFPENEHAPCPDPADAVTALTEALAFMIVVVNTPDTVNVPNKTAAVVRQLQTAVDQRLREHVILNCPMTGTPSASVHREH